MLRLGQEWPRFIHAGREWLVDDDVKPPRERLQGQRRVRAIRRGDHDQIEGVRPLPQSRRGVDDARIGVHPRGIALALGVAGDDDRRRARYRRDRLWKDAPARP